ncbi:zinc finger HIT domain-containing protein 2 [Ochlerotatus camptorhynchus]|uniref:zinc finger HIT domain-containing protein 2 n=1 Tax=Ochlerotatus camptorhynchus TaxID=644619 RepID=UPI0031D90DB1
MDQAELCKICNSAASKYCCPRCNILYCSLSCYKSEQHGQCSESFYRENVIQEMTFAKDEQEAAQSSGKMMDILKRLGEADLQDGTLYDVEEDVDDDDEERFEEIDSDDGENFQNLADRLGGIDLDNADAVWGQLTDEERREFQNLLENGDISQILPIVEPWWTRDYNVELIQSANSKKLSGGEKDLIEKCPALKKGVKNFKDLCSKDPSPLMKFNLANILAAYALAFRYFNGDFKECLQEVANCLISICGNLKHNTIYHSEKLAVESVCHDCRQEQLPADHETALLIAQDVREIFDGPLNCGIKYKKHFVLAALSDVHRLLSQAKRDDKQLQQTESEKHKKGEFSSKYSDDIGQLPHLELGKLKSCTKKIEFMLSYVKDYL